MFMTKVIFYCYVFLTCANSTIGWMDGENDVVFVGLTVSCYEPMDSCCWSVFNPKPQHASHIHDAFENMNARVAKRFRRSATGSMGSMDSMGLYCGKDASFLIPGFFRALSRSR